MTHALARCVGRPDRRRGARRGVAMSVASIIIVVLLVASSVTFFTLLARARQQQSATLVQRGEGKVVETGEEFDLASFTAATNVIAVDVTNVGSVPVRIAYLLVLNQSTDDVNGTGSGFSPTNLTTVDLGQTVALLSTTTPVANQNYTIKVLTERGTVRTTPYPPPGGAVFPEPIPRRENAGNLTYDLQTIEWTVKLGGTWQNWSTGTTIPKGEPVVWRMTITNHGSRDLWMKQNSVLFGWTDGGKSRGFYIINPNFRDTLTVAPLNEMSATQAQITPNATKVFYFGTTSPGGSSEQKFAAAAAIYAAFVLLYGQWDNPPATTGGDPTEYYGQDIPYKGLRTV